MSIFNIKGAILAYVVVGYRDAEICVSVGSIYNGAGGKYSVGNRVFDFESPSNGGFSPGSQDGSSGFEN
jgi:hypothetical protein